MAQKLRNLLPIKRHFRHIQDPRIDRQKLHLLTDIIVITICAVICGADEWTEIALFGKAKKKWFKTFLELPNGIPSHDTFARLFARLNPNGFRECFLRWVDCVREKTSGEVIPIDGKTLKNSFDKASSKTAIHMVSAWSAKNKCVLGQVKVDAKSNEITAVPRLLELLELSGCIITMDAMGCQKEHAQTIINKEADYIFSLKGNQGHFHEEVKTFFEYALESNFEDVPHQYLEKTEKDHGRIETRRCWLLTELKYFERVKEWPGICGVGMIESTRRIEGKETKEIRIYCTSLGDVKTFSRGVRQHWQVENSLHWVLDVAFREDKCRIRKDNAPENFAILRHIALNQLKKETTEKHGIKAKRLKAGWDEEYLLSVLLA